MEYFHHLDRYIYGKKNDAAKFNRHIDKRSV